MKADSTTTNSAAPAPRGDTFQAIRPIAIPVSVWKISVSGSNAMRQALFQRAMVLRKNLEQLESKKEPVRQELESLTWNLAILQSLAHEIQTDMDNASNELAMLESDLSLLNRRSHRD